MGTVELLKLCIDGVRKHEDAYIDQMRGQEPFSPDIAEANGVLWDPTTLRIEKAHAILGWMRRQLPDVAPTPTPGSSYTPSLTCRFAQREANPANDNPRMFTLVLHEDEVVRLDDTRLREIIQLHRAAWKRLAFHGLSSAFIIAIVGEHISRIKPEKDLMRICQGLMSMYLDVEVQPDQYNYDAEFCDLGIQSGGRLTARRFGALTSIFLAQGDKRWWRDHRGPGGIIVSTNSVGHYAYRAHNLLEGAPLLPAHSGQMLSLAKATIKDSFQGDLRVNPHPATWLKSVPGSVDKSDDRQYNGWYHTDHLIPRVYFDERQSRATDSLTFYDDLDFSYIHDHEDSMFRDLFLGTETRLRDVRPTLMMYPDHVLEGPFGWERQREIVKKLELETSGVLRVPPRSENWMSFVYHI